MAQFTGAGDLIINGANDVQVSDIEFAGTGELYLDGSNRTVVERVTHSGVTTRVINAEGTGDLVLDKIIGAILLNGCSDTHLTDIQGDVYDSGSSITLVKGWHGAAYTLDQAAFFTIQGQGAVALLNGAFKGTLDVFGTVNASEAADVNILLTSVDEDFGLKLDACSDINAYVSIKRPEGHGVEIEECADVTVMGSVVAAGQSTTADCVHLAQTSTYSSRVRVMVRTRGDGDSRAGIYVDTGVTDAIIVGNDLGPAAGYGTAPLVDNGTNTILSYPGHATYGDNFVA